MEQRIKNEDWVWVLIQDPERDEQILGQRDDAQGIFYIPAFLTKEEAFQGLPALVRQPDKKYEAQAIIYEDLVRYAVENSAMIYLLNGAGQVQEKIFT